MSYFFVTLPYKGLWYWPCVTLLLVLWKVVLSKFILTSWFLFVLFVLFVWFKYGGIVKSFLRDCGSLENNRSYFLHHGLLKKKDTHMDSTSINSCCLISPVLNVFSNQGIYLFYPLVLICLSCVSHNECSLRLGFLGVC